MVSAVIVAGGRGTRMGAEINKVFLPLCGKAMILHTVGAFDRCADIDEIVVVTGKADIPRMTQLLKGTVQKPYKIAEGGAERQASVYNGLCAASGELVAIHDGARCLITEREISETVEDAKKYGAASLGVKVKDTLKHINKDAEIIGTVDRESTVQIQTPQVFGLSEIKRLHEQAAAEGISVTDDCAVYEHFGKAVHLTEGSYMNIKLTTPEDMELGEYLLYRRNGNESGIRL